MGKGWGMGGERMSKGSGVDGGEDWGVMGRNEISMANDWEEVRRK